MKPGLDTIAIKKFGIRSSYVRLSPLRCRNPHQLILPLRQQYSTTLTFNNAARPGTNWATSSVVKAHLRIDRFEIISLWYCSATLE